MTLSANFVGPYWVRRKRGAVDPVLREIVIGESRVRKSPQN
jgi:hypothetical protein